MFSPIIQYFRETGIVARLYTAALFILAFVGTSNHIIGEFEFMALYYLLLLVVFSTAIWLIHFALWSVWLRRRGRVINHPWQYWTYGPMVTVIAILVCFTPAFLTMRFLLSEPFLRRDAVTMLANASLDRFDRYENRRVGLYWIHSYERLDANHINIETVDHGVMQDGGGFSYSADGTEPSVKWHPSYYQPFMRHWRLWTADY